MTNIAAGYQLHVTSWENDADNYKTIITDRLSKEDVEFYIDIASKFTSRNNRKNPGYGNDGIKDADLINLIETQLKKHLNKLSSTTKELWSDFDEEYKADQYYELLTDRLLSIPTEDYYPDNFCRVVESVKVFYFPEEIKEVTSEFTGLTD